MSIFGDNDINDLLNDNIQNDEDLLPYDEHHNDQIFSSNEQVQDENQQGVAPVKIEPKKRNVNPRPHLNVEVLRGPRGIHTIEDYFKDVKFKGKGKEKEDLDEIMRRLQHWGHRMYPTYKFDDLLANIERIGKKKPLQVHMSRYRLGMLETMKHHEEINEEDDDDNDVQNVAAVDEPYDEFDALLDEQIAISKDDDRTPARSNSRHSVGGMGSSTSISSSHFATPSFSKNNAVGSTPYAKLSKLNDTSDLAVPLPPSQPPTPVSNRQLSTEQMSRIAENRKLALERLAAKKRLQKEALQTI